MDNVLRGGFPIKLAGDKIFYVYSRKHGDIERDYNYFSMLPEFYSQGNGNFRDVNQNRRCDTFFAPFVEKKNIKEFYSFIQLDGYNLLGIEKLTYQLTEEKAETVLAEVACADAKAVIKAFVTKPFTPGWLENESIWLHMEYKYLLELIRNGMYEEFFFHCKQQESKRGLPRKRLCSKT